MSVAKELVGLLFLICVSVLVDAFVECTPLGINALAPTSSSALLISSLFGPFGTNEGVSKPSLSPSPAPAPAPKTETDPSPSKGYVPQVTTISSMEEYLDFVGDTKDDRLCIVKFYANWCKSCAKFDIHYKKLALGKGDKVASDGTLDSLGRVRFAEVEFGQNAAMCKSFGIKRLPYIHMYKGTAGKVADFSCGPKKFNILLGKIDEFVDLPVQDVEFKRALDSGNALGDDILQELKDEGSGNNTTGLHM